MEQIQNASEVTSKSWFYNKQLETCRRLVINTLSKIENGYIELIESGGITELGDITSDKHARIFVENPAMYIDFVKGGSIGAAEAYIAGHWSSPDLTTAIHIIALHQRQLEQLEKKASWFSKLKNKLFHLSNNNTLTGSKSNIMAHYDLGNELYTRFLDDSMMYSSAIYSDEADTLAKAQHLKLDTICQQLKLTASDHVVEIGTGWGGFAIHAAQYYGCKVTTTTISEEQYSYAVDKVNQLGLTDKITLLKKDYRKLTGQYDKLVSIEMIEAVGHKYYSSFFNKCDDLVKPGGCMLIQSITIADQRYQQYISGVDFIQKYIFPGGCLPSIEILAKHISNDSEMVIENIRDIGLDYARTLNDWRINFDNHWHELAEHGFDNQFKRLWHYYFSYCEGAFLARATSTVQLLARK